MFKHQIMGWSAERLRLAQQRLRLAQPQDMPPPLESAERRLLAMRGDIRHELSSRIILSTLDSERS